MRYIVEKRSRGTFQFGRKVIGWIDWLSYRLTVQVHKEFNLVSNVYQEFGSKTNINK